jgi:hypothetical protein
VIRSRVITFNGSIIVACTKSSCALISRCPWCWFRFSVYRPTSSVTHSQRKECAATLPTTRLFVPQNWQLFEAESHWGQTQLDSSSGWTSALCDCDCDFKAIERPKFHLATLHTL